ncbi:MAG: metallophosphoesterase [Clostridia bacterium]|nr:metallophosphoesterase [Clostridia bacterium]
MKKIIALLLVLVMTAMVCGCGEKSYQKEDGTNVVTTYKDGVSFAIFTDAHVGASESHNFRVTKAVEFVNQTDYIDFAVFLGDNIHSGYTETDLAKEQVAKFKEITSGFEKPYYYLRGNHDEVVYDFPEHFVVECGDVAFLGIQIVYKEHYNIGVSMMRCFPTIEQKELEWIEETLAKCKGKRIIMGAHFAIVNDNPHFKEPLVAEWSPEQTGREAVNFGREKLLELAEKYNVEIFFNGHEHNRDVPNGVAGTMIDFNLGSIGGDGVYSVVTVEEDKAIIEIRDLNVDGIRKKLDYQFRFDIVKWGTQK